MAKIIAMANHKGGVGKTTTVVNIGSLLSTAGIKTLLVDLDAQCNLTDTFIKESSGRETVYNLFRDGKAPQPVNVKPNLDLIPGSIDMTGLDLIIGGTMARESILKKRLAELDENEDYKIIILDCPPSLSLVTINAFVAADYIFVPVVPEVYPLRGLEGLKNICKLISEQLGTKAQIDGIIVTKYNSAKKLYIEVDSQLRDNFGDAVFKTRVRENVKLAECTLKYQDIYEYAPKSNGANDYMKLTEEMLDRIYKGA